MLLPCGFARVLLWELAYCRRCLDQHVSCLESSSLALQCPILGEGMLPVKDEVSLTVNISSPGAE